MYESAVTVDNKNYWLLGNNFMRGFYSVFDLDNTKFGFAPLAGSTATAPGSSAQYGGEPTTIMAENVKSPYATNDKKHDNKNKKDKKKKKQVKLIQFDRDKAFYTPKINLFNSK